MAKDVSPWRDRPYVLRATGCAPLGPASQAVIRISAIFPSWTVNVKVEGPV